MSTSLVVDQVDPDDSLFSQQFNENTTNNEQAAWWQKNFLLQQPKFVNAWNGIFPTVIVNIFGIVIFLRLGWIVGTAGVFQSLIIVLLCTLFSMVTVLSAIGICDRCQIKQGGIYFLISHVLGKRIGGSVGIIYTFGQAIATSLVALGFGESIGRLLLGEFSQTTAKIFGGIIIIVLNALNFAGLRFIIRLQLLLMCFLGVAIFDFIIGALLTQDPEHGFNYLSRERLFENWDSHYTKNNCTFVSVSTTKFQHADSNSAVLFISATATAVTNDGVGGDVKIESFFSVFGVLFANFIGVLAGVNMGTNLQNPQKDIAEGELSALAVSFSLCSAFVLMLGAGVDRYALLCDFMISEKISLTKIFFISGLYISCLSSILSSTLGTSRVIQGIASEGLVPIFNSFAEEEHSVSSDKNPLRATILVTIVSVLFLFLGNLNELAILSAIPFLVTYAFVNYAYVSLAMSADLNLLNEEISTKATYGSLQDFNTPTTSGPDSDHETLDKLFSNKNISTNTSNINNSSQFIGYDVERKPWYTMCINRYVSFAAAIVHVLIIIFINKWFALFHLIAFIILYLNIGQSTSPAFEQGISQFSIAHMIQVTFQHDKFDPAKSIQTQRFTVIPPSGGPAANDTAQFKTAQLNDANEDYSLRKQYHHTKQVGNID